jgi:hypothetical protein
VFDNNRRLQANVTKASSMAVGHLLLLNAAFVFNYIHPPAGLPLGPLPGRKGFPYFPDQSIIRVIYSHFLFLLHYLLHYYVSYNFTSKAVYKKAVLEKFIKVIV